MIRWHDAYDLVWAYSKKKFKEQIKAVAFIVSYLFLFQTLVLGLPVSELPKIVIGILFVVSGLTLFMEGLVLGIMPIGESLGLKLPAKVSLFLILSFAFILGLGATLAEPAIGILRAMGENVDRTEAPLLYYILNFKTHVLIACVGAGVGCAVVLGVLRFLYNWSLKPLIFPLVIICLALSSYGLFNENFAHVLGLAWDCGAVTTGPVTVPLVIALGLGISRVVTGHTEEGTSSGFGVVTLASLLPIISVLLMALYFLTTVDFSSEFANLPFASADSSSIRSIVSDFFSTYLLSFKKHLIIATQAILPLCALMFVVYRLFLKEKFTFPDEIGLGVILAFVGMTLFNVGIEFGLGKLGKQIGRLLPASYSSIQLTSETKLIQNFDLNTVQYKINEQGEKEAFFYLIKNGSTVSVPFDEDFYDPITKSYRYTPVHGPLWGQDKFSLIGIFVVLLFAFFMGYGATLAEPALNALGTTVEDISVGTFKKSVLVQTVAVGVGVGILMGVTKIIWNVPLFWLLAPPYLVLLFLTKLSSEDFVNIAWDSAGVTTGPVTVPLVLAMGIGIGSQSGAIEGFGILAMASVCPIMSVLIMGLLVQRRRDSLLIEEDKMNAEVMNAT